MSFLLINMAVLLKNTCEPCELKFLPEDPEFYTALRWSCIIKPTAELKSSDNKIDHFVGAFGWTWAGYREYITVKVTTILWELFGAAKLHWQAQNVLSHWRSFKVIENGTVRQIAYEFLFVFRCNYGRCKPIVSDIKRDIGPTTSVFRTSFHLTQNPFEFFFPKF